VVIPGRPGIGLEAGVDTYIENLIGSEEAAGSWV